MAAILDRCGFKIFKMAILDSQTEWFKQVWITLDVWMEQI